MPAQALELIAPHESEHRSGPSSSEVNLGPLPHLAHEDHPQVSRGLYDVTGRDCMILPSSIYLRDPAAFQALAWLASFRPEMGLTRRIT